MVEITTQQKSDLNKAFQGKLSWKRKEVMQMKSQIKDFVADNFNIEMPEDIMSYKTKMKTYYNTEEWTCLREEYHELINMYYTLSFYGQSFASLFRDTTSGKIETYTLAHTYSKHRFDPVCNMRKANLIRSVYRKYLKDSQIYKDYHPVHITLTLPHKGGKYNGNDFYAKELIDTFNLIRKCDFWKKAVYAGEYGVEVKESANKENGLHIHIHSLAFLKNKNVNDFRKKLKHFWEKKTGASQIWVETVYFHKKDDNGKFITEIKESSQLDTFKDEDGMYQSQSKELKVVRKKFYVDREQKEIEKRTDLSQEEKENTILDFYLKAILETIKYHFKFEAIKTDRDNYNIFLINEILKNTKGKRLYSRFGKFYKVDALNFNNLGNKTASKEIELASAQETAINPFTLQEVPAEETDIVIFRPERQKRQPKNSPFAYDLINYRQDDFYTFLDKGLSIKQVIQNHFNTLFNKSALQIKENQVKARKNKGNNNFTYKELQEYQVDNEGTTAIVHDFEPQKIPDEIFRQLGIDFNDVEII
jgi:hypothetical protein